MPDNDAHHLDQLAREQGFPSYAAWSAWNAQRQHHSGMNGPGTQYAAPAQAAPQQGEHSNILQYLLSRIPPFSIIGHVADEYGKATGT